MEYIFVIFGLGIMVTLVVAKGILQANDFAAEAMEGKEAQKKTE